ncbi:MAG: tRNA lysidine(34) synthetase TilS [Alteraurantiacibacter sp.]
MAGSTAIDPALVERFKAALDRLNPEGGKLGLAVSGGPDSMAMLLLAQQVIPGRFEVATVNHGLREEAAEECALVAAACEARGIPCEVLEVTVGAGNVQAKAREARYSALDDWAVTNFDAIATAHHADDQVETLIMRLNRGSGLRGLAGVWEVGETGLWNVPVIRPLLRFRRAELRDVVERAGIVCVNDPSNDDESFERVRVRKFLADVEWIDPVNWAQSASHLAEAEDALDIALSAASSDYVTKEDNGFRLRDRGPREFTRRLAEQCIARLGGTARGSDLSVLLDRLRIGEQGNIGGVLVRRENSELGNSLFFRHEPPRRT